MTQAQTIAVSATFTAELLESPLAFWMQELQMPSRIVFAPYNQVFQQLIDPTSELSRNADGINVILVRFEDWHRPDCGTNGDEFRVQIEKTAEEFARGLLAAADRSGSLHMVGMCPMSPALANHPVLGPILREIEDRTSARLQSRRGIMLMTADEVQSAYPVDEWYNPEGEELGRIPFTPAFFTAMGTVLARRIFSHRSPPRKVIAVDCDETLWSGVCGEVGPHGIALPPHHLALQQFLVEQYRAGMLVCLCSKNSEEDVWQVFDSRPEMPLRREHVTASRVNWQAKSTNLRALAKELGLGLDSFIFLDDSPVECAEVEANCPTILTLRLPQPSERIPEYLKNVWAFDHFAITEEDRLRTSLYRDNVARERLRYESPTMADFLKELQLEVRLFEPGDVDLARIAQLTQRTNQFNFTTVRRSESEIRSLVGSRKLQCIAVQVRDRFGDYGLVGLVLFRTSATELVVDTFLLSCRVLGRGVEHRMLRKLGELAETKRLKSVVVSFVPSPKNNPARDFLESVGSRIKNKCDEGRIYRFPAEVAAGLASQCETTAPNANGVAIQRESVLEAIAPSRVLARIAQEMGNVEAIHTAINTRRRRSRDGAKLKMTDGVVAPRTPIESALADIWVEVLGIDPIGIHDDFFQLGGDSLLATQIVSRLWGSFHVKPPLSILFDAPTVAGLAEAVVEAMTERIGGLNVEGLLDEVERSGAEQGITQTDHA